VVNQVRTGVTATGRTREWGLNWPEKSIAGTTPFIGREDKFTVAVELLNDQRRVIGRQNVTLPYGWTTSFSRSVLTRENGVLTTRGENGALTIIPVANNVMEVTFTAVKADDITDKLNIRIAGINGDNAQIASRNRRISIIPADEYRKNSGYLFGDTGPAGGIVFYDKGSTNDGWRYLEAAPTDLGSSVQWGAYGKEVGGTGTEVGSGKLNTQLIVDRLRLLGESGKAAQLCTQYRGGGMSDWFLPSKDELDLMYMNLKAKGLGGFSNNYYWSSSEYNGNGAWGQSFSTGRQLYDFSVNKNSASSVRAVRAF
jgi:hypothetical protein